MKLVRHSTSTSTMAAVWMLVFSCQTPFLRELFFVDAIILIIHLHSLCSLPCTLLLLIISLFVSFVSAKCSSHFFREINIFVVAVLFMFTALYYNIPLCHIMCIYCMRYIANGQLRCDHIIPSYFDCMYAWARVYFVYTFILKDCVCTLLRLGCELYVV